MNEIGIKIAADITDLSRKMQQGGSLFASFQNAASNAASGIEQSFEKISQIDFSAEFSAAAGRINASIDSMVNAALGLGDGFDQGAKISIRSLDQLESEIRRVEDAISANTDLSKFEKLNAELQKLQLEARNLRVVGGLDTTFNRIGSAAGNVSSKLTPLSNTSRDASGALLGITRVVQDLPFGFAAIGNNIEELPRAFSQLSASAGGTGAAFKALGASLLGGGGIGLAVSAITTAITFATIGFGAWSRSASQAGNSLKNAASQAADFNKVLSEVSGQVASQAERVTTLVNALQSGTLDTKQRKKAIEDLKQQNEEYFGALKEEKGVIEGLKTAYDQYLANLDKMGRAKAVESELTKLFDKKLQLELTIDPKFINATSEDVQKQIGKLKKQLEDLGGPVDITKPDNNFIDASGKVNESLTKRINIQKEINDLEQGGRVIIDQSLAKTRKQIDDIELRIKGLTKVQSDLGVFNIVPDKGGSGKSELEKQMDLLKKQIAALEELKKELGSAFSSADEFKLTNLKIELNNLEPQLTDAEKTRFTEQLKKDFFSAGIKISVPAQLDFSQTLRGKLEEDLTKNPIDISKALKKNGGFDKTGDEFLTPAIQTANEKLDQLRENAKKVSDLLSGPLKGAFDDLFNGIISGSQNAFQAFGNALTQLIQKLIVAAVEAAIFSAIISAVTGGFGATAAGGGFASNFKNLFSSFSGIPKFADGGVASGPKSGFLAVLHGNELVVPLDKASQGGVKLDDTPQVLTGKLTAEGDKLVAVVSVINKRRKRV